MDEVHLARFLYEFASHYTPDVLKQARKRIYLNVRDDEWPAPVRAVSQRVLDEVYHLDGRVKVISHATPPKPGTIDAYLVDDDALKLDGGAFQIPPGLSESGGL